MMNKKIRIIVIGMLMLSMMLVGCGKKQAEDTSTNNATSPETTKEVTNIEPIEIVYDYIKAVLKDNKLQITLLSEYNSNISYYDQGQIQYDTPYDVEGLSGTYKDMYVGTIGQEICPYVFLITSEDTVECVPVGDQISESSMKSLPQVTFSSIGVLPDLKDVVSFKEESISGPNANWGYISVVAEDTDGVFHDLSFNIAFARDSYLIPPSEDVLKEKLTQFLEQEIHENSKELEPEYINEYAGIENECCRIFALGTDQQKANRELLYGVCGSGAIWFYEDSNGTWVSANQLATIYDNKSSYNDLFMVMSDPTETLYKEYEGVAETISTPVVGNEPVSPVLIIPLQQKIHMTVELIDQNPDDPDAKSQDVLFDEDISLNTPYFISTALSDNVGVLRVTATYNDGYEDLKAVWFNRYYEGSSKYRQYVVGEYQ